MVLWWTHEVSKGSCLFWHNCHNPKNNKYLLARNVDPLLHLNVITACHTRPLPHTHGEPPPTFVIPLNNLYYTALSVSGKADAFHWRLSSFLYASLLIMSQSCLLHAPYAKFKHKAKVQKQVPYDPTCERSKAYLHNWSSSVAWQKLPDGGSVRKRLFDVNCNHFGNRMLTGSDGQIPRQYGWVSPPQSDLAK